MKRTQKRSGLFSLIAIATIAILIVVGYRNAAFSNVSVNVDGKKVEVQTDADTVQDVLRDNNIVLDAHDKVNYALNQQVIEGMNIQIARAIEVTIQEKERTTLVKTHEKTVGDVLDKLNNYVDADDIVSPSRETSVTPAMVIEVKKVDIETQEVNVPIEHQSITNLDKKLAKGKTILVQKGQDGLATYKKELIYVDGSFQEERILETIILKKATTEIFSKGTYVKPKAVAKATVKKSSTSSTTTSSRTESSAEDPKVIIMTATAYCDVGTTASGLPSGPGKVAVDPKVIPLGTKLLIETLDSWPSYGHAVAADTGGAVKGYIVDLWYASYDKCIEFGRRKVKVTILN